MELNVNQLLAQIVNFLILFFLLKQFLWKNFIGILESRRERIAAEFRQIESTKAELERLKTEYATQMAHIEETSRAKMQTAVQEGQRIAEEIHQNSMKEAKEILENAKQEVQFEIAKAREEIKRDVIVLTMQATENLIGEKLTPQQDQKLVEQFIQGVAASNEK